MAGKYRLAFGSRWARMPLAIPTALITSAYTLLYAWTLMVGGTIVYMLRSIGHLLKHFTKGLIDVTIAAFWIGTQIIKENWK